MVPTKESLQAEVEALWQSIRDMDADVRGLWLQVTRMPADGGSRADSPLFGFQPGGPAWTCIHCGEPSSQHACPIGYEVRQRP